MVICLNKSDNRSLLEIKSIDVMNASVIGTSVRVVKIDDGVRACLLIMLEVIFCLDPRY